MNVDLCRCVPKRQTIGQHVAVLNRHVFRYVVEGTASIPHHESKTRERLPETRVDLLKVVSQRTMSPDRKYIFWLNGIVGT
jgi:hypothetical protein